MKKTIFLDINFICDLVINRQASEASREKLEELLRDNGNVFLATSSISTIYYIANNTHKKNQFAIQQMDFLQNKAVEYKDKLDKENAFEIASFFIKEILKKPKEKEEKNVSEIIYKICKNMIELVPLSSNATLNALEYCKDNPQSDLEDVLQYFIAKENNCDEIYTNDRNFPKLDITLINSYGNVVYKPAPVEVEQKKQSWFDLALDKLKEFVGIKNNKNTDKTKPKRNKQ